MTLQEFIDAQGLNYTSYARRLGWAPQVVQRYCLPEGHPDRRIPRPDAMREIYRDTRGKVTPNDFYGVGQGAVA